MFNFFVIGQGNYINIMSIISSKYKRKLWLIWQEWGETEALLVRNKGQKESAYKVHLDCHK